MERLVLAAALLASTGCIITEDAKGMGVTLELSWDCPPDADEISLVTYPLDADGFIEGDGIPDTVACDQTQPARFLFDPGDWYIEGQPLGSIEYYFLGDTFTGEEMDTPAVELVWDPNMGAFMYHWEIGGANPATGCNSRDVSEVTLIATNAALPEESHPDTYPCQLGAAQSRPVPIDRYIISGAPDDGPETVLATDDIPDEYELVDPAGLLDLPTIDIAVVVE